MEERIYRFRCVEAWSMVIPWVGFQLSDLLERFEPLPSAKYVGFETLVRPSEMRGQKLPILPWPYVEGLRMDEAMHPLTIMATGLYGEDIPNQNGAPSSFGRAVEVRVQVHQVDRQDHADRGGAADDPGTSPIRANTASIPT